MAVQEVRVSDQEAMELAEASRQKEWKQPSFLRQMFLGEFRLDLIHPILPRGCSRAGSCGSRR